MQHILNKQILQTHFNKHLQRMGTWQAANSNGTAWRDGFNQAVTLIRNAGINTTLIIDAVGYGQILMMPKYESICSIYD